MITRRTILAWAIFAAPAAAFAREGGGRDPKDRRGRETRHGRHDTIPGPAFDYSPSLDGFDRGGLSIDSPDPGGHRSPVGR